MKTRGHMQVPHHSLTQRGAVHCVLWAKIPNEAHKMLFFGTGLGYLVMWTMSVSESIPIQGIILMVLNYIYGDPEEFSEVSVQRAAHGREVTSLQEIVYILLLEWRTGQSFCISSNLINCLQSS